MAKCKLVKVTPELVPATLEVLRDSFFTDEKVCNCVRLLDDSPEVPTNFGTKCTVASLELEHLVTDTTKDGVSVAAVDEETNEVLGVVFNKIQVLPPTGELSYFEKFNEEHIHDPSSKALMTAMIEIDCMFDLFAHFKATCGLELMFLAVKNSAKGRGIGQALVEETLKVAERYEASPKPTFVSAIFSSRFSQKAGIRGGMEKLMEVPYTDLEYKGKKYSETIGPDHPFAAICAKSVP